MIIDEQQVIDGSNPCGTILAFRKNWLQLYFLPPNQRFPPNQRSFTPWETIF